MNRLSHWARTGLLALLAFSGLGAGMPSAAMAQSADNVDFEPDSYVSGLSDLEIEISGRDFEIFDVELLEYSHGEGEVVSVSSLTAFLDIAFFDDADTNQETLEIYNEGFASIVDEFEILDEGESRDTVYTFAVASYSDVDFYFYLAVTEDVVGNVDIMQSIYAPDTTFLEDFELAQEDVSIDGDGFLEDVDVDDLASLMGEEPDSRATEEIATEEPENGDRGSGRTSSDDADHVFELVPSELVAEGDASVVGVVVEPPVVEQVELQLDGSDAAAIIQLMQNPMNSESTLDFMLGNFETSLDSLENIGTDATATSAWTIDVGEVDGEQSLIFVWVDSARYDRVHYVEVLIASEATFLDDLDQLSADVSVDGEAMFSGIDRDMLEGLLEDYFGSGRQVEDDSRSTRDTSDEDDDRDQQTDAFDFEAQGLISETEYESPQYGYGVEWDSDAWMVDLEWELTASSNEETGVDTVIVLWREGDVSLIVQVAPSGGDDIEDIVAYWETDEFSTDGVGAGAELVMSDTGRWSGATVYLWEDAAGDELSVINEVLDLDGGETFAYITMIGAPDLIGDAYADAEELVTIDGEDAVGTFTPREIRNAVAP